MDDDDANDDEHETELVTLSQDGGDDGASTSSNGGWIRDLSTEGIEPNPGPGPRQMYVCQNRRCGMKHSGAAGSSATYNPQLYCSQSCADDDHPTIPNELPSSSSFSPPTSSGSASASTVAHRIDPEAMEDDTSTKRSSKHRRWETTAAGENVPSKKRRHGRMNAQSTPSLSSTPVTSAALSEPASFEPTTDESGSVRVCRCRHPPSAVFDEDFTDAISHSDVKQAGLECLSTFMMRKEELTTQWYDTISHAWCDAPDVDTAIQMCSQPWSDTIGQLLIGVGQVQDCRALSSSSRIRKTLRAWKRHWRTIQKVQQGKIDEVLDDLRPPLPSINDPNADTEEQLVCLAAALSRSDKMDNEMMREVIPALRSSFAYRTLIRDYWCNPPSHLQPLLSYTPLCAAMAADPRAASRFSSMVLTIGPIYRHAAPFLLDTTRGLLVPDSATAHQRRLVSAWSDVLDACFIGALYASCGRSSPRPDPFLILLRSFSEVPIPLREDLRALRFIERWCHLPWAIVRKRSRSCWKL